MRGRAKIIKKTYGDGPCLSTTDPASGPVNATPRFPIMPRRDVFVTESESLIANCGAYAEYRYIVPHPIPIHIDGV